MWTATGESEVYGLENNQQFDYDTCLKRSCGTGDLSCEDELIHRSMCSLRSFKACVNSFECKVGCIRRTFLV